MNCKSSLWALMVLVLLVTSCQPHSTITTEPIQTQPTAFEPDIPLPPTPTNTPLPGLSASPTPTNPPLPSPTATPTPQIPVGLGALIPYVHDPIRIGNAQNVRLLANYERYNPGMTLIKLTPDEKYYFVVSPEGIDIYSTQTGQVVRHHNILLRLNYAGDGYLNNDLQFTQDNNRFMARVDNRNVAVFNMEGQEIYSYPFPAGLSDSGGAALSPDGKYLTIDICSDCKAYKGSSGFEVIDITSGDVVYEYGNTPGGNARGASPFYSADGKILATQIGAQIMLWNTENWKEITNFSIDTEFKNYRLAYSPDSTTIAIFSAQAVTVWRLEGRHLLSSFDICGTRNTVPQAIFSPDNTYIAILNCQKIDIWNIADSTLISEEITNFTNITGMRLGTDGKLTTYLPKPTPGVVNAPWNSWDYTGGLKFTGEQASLQLDFVSHSYPGNVCSISSGGISTCAEGEFLIASDGRFYQALVDKTHLELHPGTDGSAAPILSFEWTGYKIDAVGLDVAHQLFVYEIWSTPHSATVYLMDTTNGRTIIQWPNVWIKDRMIAFSPDGNLAAFYLAKNPGARLILYDLADRKVVYQLNSFSNSMGDVAFSADGKFLVDYLRKSGDRQADFYEIMEVSKPANSTRYRYPVVQDAGPSTSSFSPDGSLLAIGFSNGILRLFDTRDGSMVNEWKANGRYLTGLTFSPDMKYLASASIDGTIRIWGVLP